MRTSSLRGAPLAKEAASMRRLERCGGLDVLQATYHRHSFPPHVHDTFVIELVEQGIDEFTCDRGCYRAHAGDIVFIHPGEVHSGRPVGEVPLSYQAIYPSPEVVAEVAASLGHPVGTAPGFHGPVLRDGQLAAILRNLFSVLNGSGNAAAGDLLLRKALATLLRRHGLESPGADGRSTRRPAVCRVLDYMRANACEPLSVDELSEIARLSLYHFIRVFREEVGLGPHEFLVNLRVDRARGLLSQGRSITEAAAATGFADQSHLTRWFKRIMGITPGNFRA
jgi:AraC-like DNA-binding protein/mannose-6-phosphate isomerase-like protein (cupin superfamily)